MNNVLDLTVEERVRMATESTKSDVLEVLGRDKNTEVLIAVATNPYTPQDILIELAKSFVLEPFVALNPKASASLLAELSSSPSISTRKNVAAHPYVSWEVLSVLASDVRYQVREVVDSRKGRKPRVF